MTELDFLIRFWKAQLETSGFAMSPSVQHEVKQTIKYLEELRKLKGE